MNYRAGFTLVEMTIILGIIAILFSVTSLNLSNITPKTSLDGALQNFIVNLKQQQLLALTNNINHGLYIPSDKYTVFKGNSYNPSDSSNFNFSNDDISWSTSASGGVIMFVKNTGNISNMVGTTITISLTQTITQQTKTITINKYGIIESIL